MGGISIAAKKKSRVPHSAKAHNETALVCENLQVRPRYFAMRLRAPSIAEHARPGQFVSVLIPRPPHRDRVFDDAETLWERGGESWRADILHRALVRRPFSFARIDRKRGEIGILFRVIGKGTAAMARMAPGQTVQLLGPLGNGFDLPPARSRRMAVLVGGGIGIAPFFALGEALRRRRIRAVGLFGALDEVNLPMTLSREVSAPTVKIRGVDTCLKADEFEGMGFPTAISTEKGRRGFKGYVSALLEGYLAALDAETLRNQTLFTCGPWCMMEAIAAIARRHGLPCQALLEGVMGCGLGVCMSCVCEVILAGGARGHKRICVDGPMFPAEEIDWAGGPNGRGV